MHSALTSFVFDGASYFSNGQIAQLVERSPEKAGVGGSNPSLATISNASTILAFSMYLPGRLLIDRFKA